MTTLYRPVTIATAEQAEALPVGTVLIRHRDDETNRVATRIRCGPSPDHVWRTGDGFHRHRGIVGMSALVPIEAEEETVVATADLDLDPEREYWSDDPDVSAAIEDAPKRTRLVTPWEDE